jgi:FtsP/CotA-like multicopper oxidase with cupredoxin domain
MQVILVNGGVITPMNVTVGDRVIIKVVNMLAAPISIHFHGILHHGTNTMDGVDGTTQRDIMPRGAQPLCAFWHAVMFPPLLASSD